MRVLLTRISILSVCVLAVSAAPARGQSPTLASVPPSVPSGEDRRRTARKLPDEASNAAKLEADAGHDQSIGNAREGVGEQGRTKARQMPMPSVDLSKGRSKKTSLRKSGRVQGTAD